MVGGPLVPHGTLWKGYLYQFILKIPPLRGQVRDKYIQFIGKFSSGYDMGTHTQKRKISVGGGSELLLGTD